MPINRVEIGPELQARIDRGDAAVFRNDRRGAYEWGRRRLAQNRQTQSVSRPPRFTPDEQPTSVSRPRPTTVDVQSRPSNAPSAEDMPNFLALQSRIDRTNPNVYTQEQLDAMGNRLQEENTGAAAAAGADIARRSGDDFGNAASQFALAQIGLGSAARTAQGREDIGFRASEAAKENELALLRETLGLASFQANTRLSEADLRLREELGRDSTNLSYADLDFRRYAADRGFDLSADELALRRELGERGFELDDRRLNLDERRTDSDLERADLERRQQELALIQQREQARREQQAREFISPWFPPQQIPPMPTYYF